jgi:RNA polymerase sigma-70 factor (ECF subfamily)
MQNISKEFASEDSQQLQQGFETLTFPLMDSLYATALAMTKDTIEAEDLLQNTYLRAYRYFYKFERGTNLRAWMDRILTNNFINEYNIKKRQQTRVDFETVCATLKEEAPSEFDSHGESGFTENYDEIFDDTITAALAGLPEKYRLAVLLCDVNDLTYKEIAKALDCPLGTVMSRLSRGRKKLARSLRKYAGEYGFTKDSQ